MSRWPSRARDAYLSVRPLLMAGTAAGGAWWAWYMLSLYPWHHFTIAWVAGVLAAVYGAVGLYRDAAARVRLWRWLRIENPTDAEARADAVRRGLRRLPSRCGQRYAQGKGAFSKRRRS